IDQYDQPLFVRVEKRRRLRETEFSLWHCIAPPFDARFRPGLAVIFADGDRIVVVSVGIILPAKTVHQDRSRAADIAYETAGRWTPIAVSNEDFFRKQLYPRAISRNLRVGYGTRHSQGKRQKEQSSTRMAAHRNA